ELNIRDSVALNPYFKYNGKPPRSLIKEHCFCYELRFPEKVTKKLFYSFMLDDLNRFSKFHGSIEKRQRRCWVMVNKDKTKNPPMTSGVPKQRWALGFMSRM